MDNTTRKHLANSGEGFNIPAHLEGVLIEVELDPRARVVASNGNAFLMGDGRWCDKYEMLHRRESCHIFGVIVTPKIRRKLRGY